MAIVYLGLSKRLCDIWKISNHKLQKCWEGPNRLHITQANIDSTDGVLGSWFTLNMVCVRYEKVICLQLVPKNKAEGLAGRDLNSG